MKKKLFKCVLTAPTSEQMTQASEHLRYWPYVKAYYKTSPKSMVLVVYLGNMTNINHRYLLKRSRELISLCLCQYGVEVSRFSPAEEWFDPFYLHKLFLRPDECLKPFSEFIKEVDRYHKKSNAIN